MEFKLPDSIASTEQLQDAVMKLDDYIASRRSLSVKQRTGVATTAEDIASPGEQIKQLLGLNDNHADISLEQLETCKSTLQRMAKQAVIVHVTLPDIPTTGLKLQLIRWLRANLSPGLLVAFHSNRGLAGGMVVRTDSHVYDFSFRTRLLKSRAVLARILRDV